jgi:phosphoribosylformimino-5-aminoimidazole carboxamide ribotide isomerase
VQRLGRSERRGRDAQFVRLYPAVDILDGRAVRLVKGAFERRTVYAEDPLTAAREWVDAGARDLHVVDLDGARTGAPVNLLQLRRITEELGVGVQYGGGLRSARAVTDALAAGAVRVVLGTAAFEDPALLDDSLTAHGPERLLVSVDVRGGLVTTAGWTERGELDADAAVQLLQERGVERFVYTNVDRDGMLEGPDVDDVERVASLVRGSLVYSGGIGALADLEALARVRAPSLEGVIVGKALYERRFTLAEAQAALAE